MTTLYRPILIETTEQAEALPAGTVAVDADHDPDLAPYVKLGSGEWLTPWETCTSEECEDYPECDQLAYALMRNSHMVGDLALIPIEAEENRIAPDAITYTRYVTAWEEA